MTGRARATILLIDGRALGKDLQHVLTTALGTWGPPPTLADHVTAMAPTFSPGTAATYGCYWRLAVDLLGDRTLDEITVVDLNAVVAEAARRAQRRRPGSSGRSSQETCIAALRALFARAIAAGHLPANPAAALTKPRRARSRRRALSDAELAELIDAIQTTSRDPDLDLLLVRFHLETGARRQGALNLRFCDLDPNRSTVWLREKTAATVNNPSPRRCSRSWNATPTSAEPDHPRTQCSGTPTATRSAPAATTPSSTAPAPAWNGPPAPP